MRPERKANYINRITELASRLEGLEDMDESACREIVGGCFLGAVNVLQSLYGPSSPQIKELSELKKAAGRMDYNEMYKLIYFADSLRGCLANAKEEIENDLIESIESQISGEIIGDFLALAKSELKAGFKDVAAVLACAALEDAMKRKATMLGLSVHNKTLDTVVNALKSKSVLKGAQASIVSSYTKLRNASMHADWSKIDNADVSSLIGFLEPFLIQNFI